MPRATASKVYEFNGFRLEGTQRRLLYQGQPVPLKGKILDLLLYLVRNRSHVVGKDELIAKVWRGRIVSDSALSTRINAARVPLAGMPAPFGTRTTPVEAAA